MTNYTYPPASPDSNNPAMQWLLSGLQLLLGDLQTAKGAGTEASERVAAAAKAVGLDRLNDELLDVIDAAITEMKPLQGMFSGPIAPEVRMLALSGALSRAAEAHRLVPREFAIAEGRAQLVGLAEALATVADTAGAGFRSRAAQNLRGLYVIIDPELTNGRDPAWIAEQAIAGGATALQLRDKTRDKGDGLPLARQISNLCHLAGVTLLINDHPDVAIAAEADGVHLGQHDLPIHAARTVLNPWQMIGTSNALVEEAMESYRHGADYIAVGRMFETSSKSNTRPAGPETLRQVREQVPEDGPPIIGIGGITPANVSEVAEAGADGICVIAAVTQAEEPRDAARELLDAFLAARDS